LAAIIFLENVTQTADAAVPEKKPPVRKKIPVFAPSAPEK